MHHKLSAILKHLFDLFEIVLLNHSILQVLLYIQSVFFVLLVVLLPGIAGAASQPLNFAVIQPGQPGDSAAARPVMDALAAYLQRRLPGSAIAGGYFNRTEEALESLAHQRPQWGIVSLGFYLEHGTDLDMTPIASTRPAGVEQERLYLLVGRERSGDWRELQGRVEGPRLFQKQAAARLLFDSSPERLPVVLQGPFNPLRAVRMVASVRRR